MANGDTFPVFVPHRVFFVFRIRRCHSLSAAISVFRAFMPAKINLMDCSCLCSEVEIYCRYR